MIQTLCTLIALIAGAIALYEMCHEKYDKAAAWFALAIWVR